MKLYLIGNSTCSNRGDSAILRGLMNHLENNYPSVILKVVSRFPNAAKTLLQREVTSDIPFQLNRVSGSLFTKLSSKIKEQWRYEHLYLMLKYEAYRKVFRIPNRYDTFLADFSDSDCIIQVGGSFFIDLYGLVQFEALMVMILSGKPVYLAGHSLGPFQGKRINRFASLVLSKVEKIYLREMISDEYLKTLNRELDNVVEGADTAWTLPEVQYSDIAEIEIKNNGKPIIAFTFRNLKPFDVRLGITQEEYEEKVADLINILIERGYHIIAISMCTGLDGYPIDDRMVAQSIKKSLIRTECMDVLMYEYNELELGYIMSKCKLLIGTRLHSVIIALRYNVPAIAIYYEHKSLGILSKLGLEDYSVFIDEVNTDAFKEKVNFFLANLDDIKKKVVKVVKQEQTNVKLMVEDFIGKYND